MGRLIDADAFKRQIAGMTIANSYSVNKANALCELIDAQPIAFDLDKVVEQLEKKIQTHARCIEYEKKNGTITEEFQHRKAVEVLKDVINIVKAGLKPCYISKEQVKELWDKKPICIEFADGSDVLAQENGYTLEQCLAMSDVRFFLDTLEKK